MEFCPKAYILFITNLFLITVSNNALSYDIKMTQWEEIFNMNKFTIKQLIRNRSMEKRDMSSTNNMYKIHVEVKTNDRKFFYIDLYQNLELISFDFFYIKDKQDLKSYDAATTMNKKTDVCQYYGKIRGIPKSWATFSICQNLVMGVISDETKTYIMNSQDGDILLYGKTAIGSPTIFDQAEFISETSKIISNTNKWRYIELVLVVDFEMYGHLGENHDTVFDYCKNVVNIVNSIFLQLDVFVVLKGINIWSKQNLITITPKSKETLGNFANYVREINFDQISDVTMLLTNQQFEENVIGTSYVGEICLENTAGIISNMISTEYSSIFISMTLAHELGHIFGLEHDSNECDCKIEKCLMSNKLEGPTSHWSNCSRNFMNDILLKETTCCLRNKPQNIFNETICGNGVLEVGEECDCGLNCYTNPCCDSETCKIRLNGTCGTGSCCNFELCQLHKEGTVCETTNREPMLCTGRSEFCPYSEETCEYYIFKFWSTDTFNYFIIAVFATILVAIYKIVHKKPVQTSDNCSYHKLQIHL